jgi:predicted nucleic acid-binding protein
MLEAVVDTSVVAALAFRESGWQELGRRVAQVDRIRVAPFFRFEVGNAIGRRRRLLGPRAASAALKFAWALAVDDRFDAALADASLDLAYRCNLSLYDAAFVALALHEHLPLWTLDTRQRLAALQCGVTVEALLAAP